MKIEVRFFITNRGGTITEENELLKVKPFYDQIFDDFGSCEGGLQIWIGNKLTNQMEDELPALVKNLCYESIAEMLKKGSTDYFYFNQGGSVHLMVDNSEIILTGLAINKTGYPLKEFVAELIGAGERFILFLQRIRTNSVEEEENLKSLQTFLKDVRDKSLTELKELNVQLD